MGDIDDQLAELAAAGDGDRAFELGYHYVHEHGDLATAERFYRVAIDAGEINALNNLARILSDQDRDDEALPAELVGGDDVAELDRPPQPALGLLLVDDDLDESERLLRSAVDADPDDAAFRHHLAVTLERQGRVDEARAEYERAARDGYATSSLALGWLLQERDGDDAAEPWFRQAMERGSMIGQTCVALVEFHRGNLDEAERLFRGAADAEPHARFNLGLMHDDRGDTAEAHRLIRQAAEEGSEPAREWLRENGG